MKRHDTPHDVAIALSRHAPRTIRALLDPAVGVGNLIAPLVRRLKRNESSVYCVDSDFDAIACVSKSYRNSLPPHARFIHSDFLSWSIRPRNRRFDCIVMNPPFAATKASLYPLVRPGTGGNETSVRYMPLEAAFICKAIDLLEQHGRLLAVVPCSVVMSDSLQWLRDEMLSCGAIRFVHELPPRSFPGVESRMYLMVFDKGMGQRQIALLNHDLHEPERLKLSLTDYRVTRLDFGFVSGCGILNQLRKFQWLDWTSLRDVAEVLRGDIASPRGPRCALHSTDFRNGFWCNSDRHDYSVVGSHDRRVRRGDILMSRVGRNACRTTGRGIGICGVACSDCVVIIRPKRIRLGMKLLFALRVVLSQDWAKALVERGTGASYISHNSLLDLPIPMAIWKKYPRHFQSFVDGERAKSCEKSRGAVQAVRKKIGELFGTDTDCK